MLPRMDRRRHSLDVHTNRMVTQRFGRAIMDIRDYPLLICILIPLPTMLLGLLLFWLTF